MEIVECPENKLVDVLEQAANMSKDEIRMFIAKVEELMKDGTPIEIPLKHLFSKDVYIREITIPKGALIAGKIHKHQNATIISQGEVSVLSIDGFQKVSAPVTFISSPGVKRLIFAHDETVWTTVHGTSETNIEKLEQELVTENYDDVITMEVKPCLL